MSGHWGDEPDEKDLAFACDICGRVCEPEENTETEELAVELQVCTACNRKFCPFCVYRIGGKEYCSRMCGVRYFFGGDDEDDDYEDED